MNSQNLKAARRARGWTQVEAAARLGLSQSYLSMLEDGQRRPGAGLARKVAKLLGLPPSFLPLPDSLASSEVDLQTLTEQLASLGFPGFAHFRARQRLKNPAEVLLCALMQKNLEPRQVEALPWLVMRYWDMDSDWLVTNAKLHDLQNRLGFVVALAKYVDERLDGPTATRVCTQGQVVSALERSRLAREDTLCQESLNDVERRWLRKNRGDLAKHWNLLTGWTPEALRYVI